MDPGASSAPQDRPQAVYRAWLDVELTADLDAIVRTGGFRNRSAALRGILRNVGLSGSDASTADAVRALGVSNHHLFSLGRNVNQIAKSLHAAPGHTTAAERNELEEAHQGDPPTSGGRVAARRRAAPDAQGREGEGMSQLPTTMDGLLQEWGTRLLYGMPRKARQGRSSKTLAGVAATAPLLSPAAVRSLVRAAGREAGRAQAHRRRQGHEGRRGALPLHRPAGQAGCRRARPVARARGRERRQGCRRQGDRGAAVRLADGGAYIPDESNRREVFNIVLSMPSETPTDIVRESARAFARETFEGHKYVFVLHDDTDSPHVHLAVRAERMDGVRLNPRKPDLRRWRERFASHLQDRGIDAVATRAVVRGVSAISRQLWRLRAGEEGRVRSLRPETRSARLLALARSQAIEAWSNVAKALAACPVEDDRKLAGDVARYIGMQFEGSCTAVKVNLKFRP